MIVLAVSCWVSSLGPYCCTWLWPDCFVGLLSASARLLLYCLAVAYCIFGLFSLAGCGFGQGCCGWLGLVLLLRLLCNLAAGLQQRFGAAAVWLPAASLLWSGAATTNCFYRVSGWSIGVVSFLCHWAAVWVCWFWLGLLIWQGCDCPLLLD